MTIQVGEVVGRLSYNCDVLFRVLAVTGNSTTLVGEEMRLLADAPIDDLKPMSLKEREMNKSRVKEQEEVSYRLFRQDAKLMKRRQEYQAGSGYEESPHFFEMRGRVLHVDGDANYLNRCTELYNKLGVPVYGVHLEEKEMPAQMTSLLEMVQPDILVVTGHDAYSKAKGNKDDLKAYRHTKYFAECVRTARNSIQNRDGLLIFAGACQSHFETLIRAGANFASSPNRVNIHALDPVYIASRLSRTSFTETVNLWDVLRNTITGQKGLGGIETKGCMRLGLPYQEGQNEETSQDR
ncbi:sporulation peptidase YabG [Shouchella patagoniensis]|uniref:sporulation peptidase YabG n=1 Tax=Shouchella patagoniensis TaxID=228576 RepID=UPI00099551C8|nr:sporulation peptidase YabG [Shouchella patagoniensis]